MIPGTALAAIHARLQAALAPPRRRYRPLRVGGAVAGWVDDDRAVRLAAFADVFVVNDMQIGFAAKLDSAPARSAALERVARTLEAEGRLTAWRDELYAAAPDFAAPPWFVIERAAARYFGIRTWAAHVNGVVRQGGGTAMWFARRSPAKAIDPGMLDNLVGGGIAARQSVADALVREAWEEAGIPRPIARQAQPVGTIELCREHADGLQRETICAHDLWLPVGFPPVGRDGEAVEHRLVTLAEAARLIAADDGPDVVTVDASLVVLDFLLRHGASSADTPVYRALDALRRPGASPPLRATD
jgi:8-oxo-dGTP pyrophosphatase MutT (NUDIX family)